MQAMDLSNFEYDHSWSMEDCRSITKAMVVAERRTNDPTQVNSTGRVCARTTMRSVQASSIINCITEFRFPVLSLHYGPPWNCQGTAANSIRRGEQLIDFYQKATDVASHYVDCHDNYIAHYAEPNPNHKAGHRQGGACESLSKTPTILTTELSLQARSFPALYSHMLHSR